MNLRRLSVTFLSILLSLGYCPAQRAYNQHSALAAGNWYRIGVKQEGMYRVDAAFLGSLGIVTTGLSSASIRLYGNGGSMLDENNATSRPDDLTENPIEVFDGGDGQFSGTDYFIFYAPGPQRWEKDSLNQAFHHRKNLYTDTAFYYITIGGTGKRIGTNPTAATPVSTVTSFNERYFYENDLINFLNSGKEWYGEEFNSNAGGTVNRSFTVDWPGLQNQPVTLITDLAGRSVGAPSSFAIKLNNQQAQTVTIPAVTGYFLDQFAAGASQRSSTVTAQSSLSVSFSWNPGLAGAQGWLNWFELHGRRALAMNGNILFFRDWSSVNTGQSARFQIGNAVAGTAVWEITDPLAPSKPVTAITGSQLSFDNDASRLREYVAFTNAGLSTPIALGKLANQDLHAISPADLLIITHGSLSGEAQRLAQFHQQHDGYKTVIVTTDQVFNEFSGGCPDPAAIRDFVKMYYDRMGTSQRPKYLLLLGSASYDYRSRISGNANLVPGFETANSLEPLNSYTTDDFFGMLNDGDDINRNDPGMLIDIGIGRIPARNAAEAGIMVDKIIRYHSSASLGAWRNQTVYVADDQDNNLHLQDAEIISADAAAANPLYNQYKIYLDAYPVVGGSGGARYPAVNEAIVNQVFTGALIFNYSGHGSYQRLAEEAILTQEELNRFNNPDKLPLFITASCDFAPHDDPAKNSLGAGILTGNSNGAIALLTTTRVVFAYSNRLINDNYLRIALTPNSAGRYLTLGESVQQAKNFTMQSTGDVINNRKFTLLGDPAMRMGFPDLRLQLTALNGQPLTAGDTLRALGKYAFSGIVTDAGGNPVPGFDGKLSAVVFDKAQQVKTLGNDPASPVTSFSQQAGVLYKGDVTVKNGQFSFSFIMPKDISYQAGRGRISLYADDGTRAANGVHDSFYIGGSGAGAVADNQGPLIKPYINDDQFMDGGLANENPVLLVKLSDSSGISTSGNGIGHDITLVIDGNERNVQVLNAFYTAIRDSYQQGQISFQLPLLSEGLHTVRIKAWDVADNSSEATLSFNVVKHEKLAVTLVRNFPNPFTNTTTFGFEHNQPNTDLDVTVLVYTRSGALVKTIHQVVNTGGSRNCQLKWAGDNQAGAKLAKGVYIYRVIVAAGDQRSESTQQLIIL
ncbi:MAG: type IX secretion system sortase PorU [Chitinophagaceae bacterium]|nr:type IX secretion system sortase PorU [Chitinophagaceae bacterium]